LAARRELVLGAIRALVQCDGLIQDDRAAKLLEGTQKVGHVTLRAEVIAEHGGAAAVALPVRVDGHRHTRRVVGRGDGFDDFRLDRWRWIGPEIEIVVGLTESIQFPAKCHEGQTGGKKRCNSRIVESSRDERPHWRKGKRKRQVKRRRMQRKMLQKLKKSASSIDLLQE